MKIHEFNITEKIHFEKSYKSYTELYHSKEWLNLWSGWQGRERREKIQKENFICAFIVLEDPKENYGKDFSIYVWSIIEGQSHIKKQTVGSSLSNQGLNVAFLDMEAKQILRSDFYAQNDNKNRSILKKRNLTILH